MPATFGIDRRPAAWMGFAFSASGALAIRVCTQCPDKSQAEADAKREGLAVVRGICPACSFVQTARRMGEQL